MNTYKVKVSVFQWFIHIFVLFFAVFLSAAVSALKTTPGASVEQILIHVLIVAAAILNLFVLYKKKNALVELDKYTIRYHNFRIATQIHLTDIMRIERTNWNPDILTCIISGGEIIIPLKIENCNDFLSSLIKIIETINYRIEFDRDNILNRKLITGNKTGAN